MLRGFDVLFVCRGFELADGRVVANSGACVGVVVGRVAAAPVKGTDAGNADGDYSHCGLDGGPDCDVDDVVCWNSMLAGCSLFSRCAKSALDGFDLQVKSAICFGLVSCNSATRRTISKTRVMIPRANIVMAPVFSLLLS